MKYDIFFSAGKFEGQIYTRNQTLSQTAKALSLFESEVNWAIEEFGRVDGILEYTGHEMVAVPRGAPYPGKFAVDARASA